MLSAEQKNKNILARFETEVTGTKIKKYTVNLKGTTFSLISMNGETLTQMGEAMKAKFGDRYVSIS